MMSADPKPVPSREAKMQGVPIGDWLLEWFSINPIDHLNGDGVADGYSYAKIAELSNYLGDLVDSFAAQRVADAACRFGGEVERMRAAITDVLKHPMITNRTELQWVRENLRDALEARR